MSTAWYLRLQNLDRVVGLLVFGSFSTWGLLFRKTWPNGYLFWKLAGYLPTPMENSVLVQINQTMRQMKGLDQLLTPPYTFEINQIDKKMIHIFAPQGKWYHFQMEYTHPEYAKTTFSAIIVWQDGFESKHNGGMTVPFCPSDRSSNALAFSVLIIGLCCKPRQAGQLGWSGKLMLVHCRDQKSPSEVMVNVEGANMLSGRLILYTIIAKFKGNGYSNAGWYRP